MWCRSVLPQMVHVILVVLLHTMVTILLLDHVLSHVTLVTTTILLRILVSVTTTIITTIIVALTHVVSDSTAQTILFILQYKTYKFLLYNGKIPCNWACNGSYLQIGKYVSGTNWDFKRQKSSSSAFFFFQKIRYRVLRVAPEYELSNVYHLMMCPIPPLETERPLNH